MELTSLSYFLALLTLVILHWIAPKALRTALLLAGSYLLYAYWDLRYLWVLIGSTILDFSLAILIDRTNQKALRPLLLAVSVCSNLAILLFFKYAGFLFQLDLGLFIPLGVSFYTFHSISYIVDIYRRKIPAARNFLDYALFVSFFPKLICGPIERAETFLGQLHANRKLQLEQVYEAVRLLLYGLFLKLCVADRLALITDKAYGGIDQAGSLDLWLGFYSFSLQIYADFFGYTLIARGSACLFGIRLSENFLNPYLSASPQEFWRRWHVSLSSWFRDYVYLPLGGRKRMVLSVLITMGLAGLWHGANLKFIFWGLYHGICLVVQRLLFGDLKNLSGAKRWIGCFLTFHLVSFGWIFFRAPDFSFALAYAARMVSFARAGSEGTLQLAGWFGILLSIWVLCSGLSRYCASMPALRLRERLHWELPVRGACLGVMLFFLMLLGVTNAEPFVYFYF